MKKIEEMSWDEIEPLIAKRNPQFDEAWDRALVLQIGLLDEIFATAKPGSLEETTGVEAVDAMCVKLRRFRSKIARRQIRAERKRRGSSDGRA